VARDRSTNAGTLKVSLGISAGCRDNRVTQIILGRSAVHGWREYLYYLAIQKLLREASHADMHIVTQEPE
jgi:two-component system sensor histidine kinase KdpD